MKVIVITSPDEVEDEPARISRFLESGVIDRVHIRKPSWDSARIAQLIKSVNPSLYGKISLHDSFEVAAETGVGGLHLNRRNPEPHPSFVGMISKSCHDPDEAEGCDYYFLSPVFDSISKEGYKARWNLNQLKGHVGRNVYALGGVTPDKLPVLNEIGFEGAAMLGWVWSRPVDEVLAQIDKFKRLCCNS